jgi:hypothetical protein
MVSCSSLCSTLDVISPSGELTLIFFRRNILLLFKEAFIHTLQWSALHEPLEGSVSSFACFISEIITLISLNLALEGSTLEIVWHV